MSSAHEIDPKTGQCLTTKEAIRDCRKKEGRCVFCGTVKVIDKELTINPLRRYNEKGKTNFEVFEGYHLPCYDISNLIKIYEERGHDTKRLKAHYDSYMKKMKCSNTRRKQVPEKIPENNSRASSDLNTNDTSIILDNHQSLAKLLDEFTMDGLSSSDFRQTFRKIFKLMKEKNTEANFIRIAFVTIRKSIFLRPGISKQTLHSPSLTPCPNMAQLNSSHNENIVLPSSWAKDLIAVMKQHLSNREVQEEALRTLDVILSLNNKYKDDFTGSAGVLTTVKSLKENISCTKVVMMGSNLLVKIALNENSKMIVYSNKEIIPLTTKLCHLARRIDHNCTVQSIFIFRSSLQIIQSLVDIDIDKKENKYTSIVTKLGKHKYFLQSLTYSMKEFCFDRALLIHIFKFIFTLSTLDGKEISEEIDAFLDSPRLIRASTKAIESLISWEALQIIGSAFAVNISQRENIGSNEIHKLAETVFRMMKKESYLELVFIHGFTLITNLCGDNFSIQIALNKFGGVGLITSYLKKNISNNLAIAPGFQALFALVNGSILEKDKFVEEGGIQLLLDALRIQFEGNLENSSHAIDQSFYLLATMLEIHSVVLTLVEDGFFQLISSGNMLRNLIELKGFQLFLRNSISIGIFTNVLRYPLLKVLLESDFSSIENSNFLKRSMDIIGNIFLYENDTGDSILSTGRKIHFLVRILNNFHESTHMQERICILLSKIFKTRDRCSQNSMEKTTETLSSLRILLNDPDKLDLQKIACLAIIHIIESLKIEAIDEAFASEISLLILSLGHVAAQSNAQPSLIEMITGLMWSLSTVNKSIENEVFSSGFPYVSTNAFVRFETEENMQKEILGFLTHIQASDHDISKSLHTDSSIEAIFNSLSLYFETEDFVERGCMLIALISTDVYYLQGLMVQNLDYFTTLVCLLHRYKYSVDIQIDIFTTFRNFSSNSAVRKFLANLGVVSLAMESIAIHDENEDVKEVVSIVISFLIQDAENDILEGLDVVSFFLSTIITNIENDFIVGRCVCAFGSLVSNESVALKIQSSPQKVVEVILNVMKRHLGSKFIQEKGSFVLWNLTTSPMVKTQIYDLGGVETILNGMSAHLECSSLQYEALGVLKSLSAHLPTKRAILENQGMEVILGDMWFHCNDEIVQHFSLVALCNLCYDSERDEVSIVTEHQLKAVSNAMATFPYSEKVQEFSCHLLKNYACQPMNAFLIVSNDQLLTLLSSAEETFPTSCQRRVIEIRNSLQEALSF